MERKLESKTTTQKREPTSEIGIPLLLLRLELGAIGYSLSQIQYSIFSYSIFY